MAGEARVTVTEDGPYIVEGDLPMSRQVIGTDDRGQSVGWVEGEHFPRMEKYALCRCGHSGRKPFCDGTHERIGFEGDEPSTARVPYIAQAQEQDGPEYILTDAPALCAFARFCDADGQVWNLIEREGGGERARQEAQLCPSGRLIAWDRDGDKPLEPDLPPSIGIVEDPQQGVSGPIWVRGGVPVYSAEGREYEVRNRVTLCRCGASRNKPFCDGSHAAIGFDDAR